MVRKNNKIPIAIIVTKKKRINRHLARAAELNACSIHIREDKLTKKYVEKIHKNKLLVFSYDVNTADQMDSVMKKGADGFFTDDPNICPRDLK